MSNEDTLKVRIKNENYDDHWFEFLFFLGNGGESKDEISDIT